MNEVIRTILSRRSTRIFKEDPLKDEEIGQILEAAKYAPSGTNQQPWNFTVVSNKELIEEIGLESKNVAKQSENKHLRDLANNDKFRPFYDAPIVIFIAGDTRALTPKEDCILASQNIMLAAESLGVGSVYLGFPNFVFAGNRREEFLKKLGIPENYEIYLSISLGYKKVEVKAAARRENVVNYIK